MTDQPHIPRPTVDQEAITAHLHAAQDRRTPVAIWTALGDIPVMLGEIQRLAALLSRTRWDFADLLAAARATLDADRDGEPDPLAYLRDQVAEHRPWPPADAGAGR
jgi:MoxR-like ATPase